MISAANFVGLWSDQFLTSKTKNQAFNITAQTRINLDMMSRMDDKGWFEDNDVQILELDFNGGGGKASLILLLPQQRNGLQDLILNKMTGSKLNDWINSTHVTNVWMEIPRFNVVNSFEIDDQLIGIGVKIFFDENQTFSGIKAATNQKPKVSGFYHGACMEVS
uniref:Serpin domain-containing protein n=1 Tax=Romanomermis culicivorax TaxID=13658 RepID=A0A915HNA6_ROMCU